MITIVALLALQDPWQLEALARRASFTRAHRGAFAAPLDGDAADSHAHPSGWHAGDRVVYAWHAKDQVYAAVFEPNGTIIGESVRLGEGRWPRVTADARRTAVAWRRGAAFVVRVHDGAQWSGEIALDGAEAAIAFAPDGTLHAATPAGLLRLDGARFASVKSGGLEQPALAIGPDGPHVAGCRGGKVVLDGAELGDGTRPSVAVGADGALHVAWLSKEGVVARSGGATKTIAARGASWPAVALSDRGARATWIGAAEVGPPALWLALLPEGKPLLMPSVQGNVTEAWLLVNLRLTSDRSHFRAHDLEISVNGVRVALFEDTVPEGQFCFPLKPYQVFPSAGASAPNRVRFEGRRMNRGHYSTAADYRLTMRTSWREQFVFASSDDDARRAADAPGVNHDQPDLVVLANEIKLPLQRPPPGKLELPVIVANLGPADAAASHVEVDGRKAADVRALKSGERVTVPVAIDWEGIDTVVVAVRGERRDFEKSNDSMTLRLWGKPGAGVGRTDPRRGPEDRSAKLRIKCPVGMPEPDFQVAMEDGAAVMTVAPHAIQHAESYAVPAGRIVVGFKQRVLTPFAVDTRAGEETLLDLTQAALLKIVPYEGTAQPTFEVWVDEQQVAVVAGHATPPADAYVLAPGTYRLLFHDRVLTPVPLTLEGARDTKLDLARDLANVRFVWGGTPFAGRFELDDADGKHVRTVASHAVRPQESYGLVPGRYSASFREGYATALALDLPQPGTRDIDLMASYGIIEFKPPADSIQADVYRGETHVVTLAGHAFPMAGRIGFAPGAYRVWFKSRVLTGIDVTVEAGKVAPIDLAASCAEVRFVTEGKPFVAPFDLFDPDGKHVRTIAGHAVPPAEAYFVSPGSWTVTFRRRYVTSLPLELSAGRVEVDLDKRHGYLVFTRPEGMESCDIYAGVKHVRTIARHAMPHEEKLGLLPGAYELRAHHLPVPLAFTVEAGKDVTPVYGTVVADVPAAWLEFADSAGKKVASVGQHHVGKRATFYLPEGEWELRFGSGWRARKVKVERGTRVTAEAQKE